MTSDIFCDRWEGSVGDRYRVDTLGRMGKSIRLDAAPMGGLEQGIANGGL